MKTRKSNAYIGQGIRDGKHIMKVGKANDIRRRERQLGINLTPVAECENQLVAFQMESELRRFVVQQGGVRYQNTLDWFHFDEHIYELILQFDEIYATLKAGQRGELPALTPEQLDLVDKGEFQKFISTKIDELSLKLEETEKENKELRLALQDIHNQYIQSETRREMLESQLTKAQDEREQERTLGREQLARETQANKEEIKRLYREISDLHREIGKLEGRLPNSEVSRNADENPKE